MLNLLWTRATLFSSLVVVGVAAAASALQTSAPQDPMGGSGLGGSAQTTLLAQARLAALPPGALAWLAYEGALSGVGTIGHRHAPAFLYGVDGGPSVTVDGRTMTLRPGQALFVGQAVPHTHRGTGRFWEIRLAGPGSVAPGDLPSTRAIFVTQALQGVPRPPVLALFVLVDLAPGSETSVHSHPGPEYIFMTKGEIVYQNSVSGTQVMRIGQGHGLPPDTAVQKRSQGSEPAAFLSLFLLDPNRPFTAPAQF